MELTECEDAVGLYRRKFDWPCTALGHCVWTLAGEAVDAVDIPEGLGRRAISALRGQGLPHSVIEVPGVDPVLRFLVQPRTSTPPGVVAELVRRRGTYLNQATIIELPPTRVIGGELSWVHGPLSTLPSLQHVVGAIAGDQNKSGER